MRVILGEYYVIASLESFYMIKMINVVMVG